MIDTRISETCKLSSRPARGGDGGNVIAQAGSLGVVTQYNSDAENVIQFPHPTYLPGSAADLERQLEAAPLFILDDDTCAVCVLAVIFSCFAVAAGLLTFAGGAIFGLIDLG